MNMKQDTSPAINPTSAHNGMTPDYALLQLLKLAPLNCDDIIKYTGWSKEKTTRTIEICLFNGKIAWKHKPSRYVPTVRNQERSAIKRPAQPKVHILRSTRHTIPATAGNRQYGKDGEVKSLAGWLHQGRTQ
jgi:hypothetical protein